MKPILFNTEMVRAILDGRKTQTRRIIKLPKWVTEEDRELGKFHFSCGTYKDSGIVGPDELITYLHLNPYKVGDILWVRETWCERLGDVSRGQYIYKAHAEPQDEIHQYVLAQNKWRPSIHMPREAARIFLKVTNVKVERLQDITEEDALKEGAKAYGPNNCSGTSARIAFAELWDGVYNNWRENPWVFVYEFERVSDDED